MKVQLPHMPLWVYDIDTDRDCRKMTDAEFGRYMRLLIRQWIEGSVPAVPTEAIRDAGLDHDSTESVQSLLDRKFSERTNGSRCNPRCREERERVLAKVQTLRENGHLGGVASALANAGANGRIRPSGSGSKSEKTTGNTATKPARARNPLWDVIAEIWFNGKVAKPHETRVGRAVQAFTELDGATPDEIRARHRRYVKKWPEISDTPESLVKHWETFAQARKVQHTDRKTPDEAAAERRAAADAEVLAERAAKSLTPSHPREQEQRA